MPRADSRVRHKPLSDAQLEAIARRFRALSVPSRLGLLNALMDGPRSMAALGAATGLSQSNLSRQVTELELAGCVARRRVGRTVLVEVADPSIPELCELVCRSLQQQAEAAHASLQGRP